MKPDFNKNPLLPAIAQDKETGRVLMLAYMNKEAFEQTQKTGKATYFSRSKNRLWVKGEESGHTQHVKQILLDCDNDTILLLVEQVGVACHTGAETCFGNKVQVGNAIIADVNKVIVERKANPVEGSYTNYLFNAGRAKICKKIGEESAETIIAASEGNKAEVVTELADLLYHSLVLLANEGIDVKEVLDELNRRENKPPEKKASRGNV